MKKETPLYTEVYQDLKFKMQCGLFRKGDRFPSYQTLCEYYKVSVAPIRMATKQLAEEGYLQISERSNTTVIFDPASCGAPQSRLNKQDLLLLEDSYASLQVIWRPVFMQCSKYCGEDECRELLKIVKQMEKRVDRIMEYWLEGNKFIHTLLEFGKNRYVVQSFDSLKNFHQTIFFTSKPVRLKDIEAHKRLVKRLQAGDKFVDVDFHALYRNHLINWGGELESTGAHRYSMEYPLIDSGERQPMYSTILIRLMRKVIADKCRPGDFLPSTKELCERYQVSTITIAHVSQVLNTLGIIQSRKGKNGGMQLLMDAESIEKIMFKEDERHDRARRYLECLEFLALTVQETARLSGRSAPFTACYALWKEVSGLSAKPINDRQGSPQLLKFITEHIPLAGLKNIYRSLWDEFYSEDIFSIPPDDDSPNWNRLYGYSLKAAEALLRSDAEQFALECKNLFTLVCEWAREVCLSYQICEL